MRNGGNEGRRRGQHPPALAYTGQHCIDRIPKAIASLAIMISGLVESSTLVSSCGRLIGCTTQGGSSVYGNMRWQCPSSWNAAKAASDIRTTNLLPVSRIHENGLDWWTTVESSTCDQRKPTIRRLMRGAKAWRDASGHHSSDGMGTKRCPLHALSHIARPTSRALKIQAINAHAVQQRPPQNANNHSPLNSNFRKTQKVTHS